MLWYYSGMSEDDGVYYGGQYPRTGNMDRVSAYPKTLVQNSQYGKGDMTKRTVKLTLDAEITIRGLLITDQVRMVGFRDHCNTRRDYEAVTYWNKKLMEVRDAYEQVTGEPMPYPEL